MSIRNIIKETVEASQSTLSLFWIKVAITTAQEWNINTPNNPPLVTDGEITDGEQSTAQK